MLPPNLESVDPGLVSVLLDPVAWLFAFVWGALWASFANVVIYRLPRGMSPVTPRSACGSCERIIPWYDNIPLISYMVLRGRCRNCKAPFALRYLMVELLGGVASLVLFARHVFVPMLIGGGYEGLIAWQLWFLFVMVLMVVTYIDLDVWIIPDSLVLPMGVLGMAVAFWQPRWLGVDGLEAVVAALLGFGLVFAIRWFYLRFRGLEGIGLGDGKLLFMVGAFLGLPGVMWTLAAGAAQGLLIAVPMMLLGRRVANTELQDVHGDDPTLGERDAEATLMARSVPFGPFLALAALEYAFMPEHWRAWARMAFGG